MTIRPVTAADHDAIHELAGLFAEEEGGLFPPPPRASIAAYLATPRDGTTGETLVAEADGRVAGFVRLRLSQRDNRHRTALHGVVHPGLRRRGLGRALYERALAESLALGRTVLTATAGDGGPGEPFLTAMGMERVHAERVSVLDLGREFAEPTPVPGYDLVHWLDGAAGPVPDSLVADLADLMGRLSTDAPSGGLAVEPTAYSPERVIELSELAASLGQVRISTGARERATGRLIAVTTLRHDGRSERLMQLITLVHPEHRGHRLGTVVKLANLEQARSVAPDATSVVATNALANEKIWRVNEALGFATAGVDGYYQVVAA
ncbi:N-acetyltransferase [Actinorhabdospora filicis]|uniref:N-acetyltransferase n=1 Tax=Actinorhabdospora filicis TaxID=1785913 RepID=A0A9W6W9W9_9ACTN|nr:GNAT family N-acetyltransferase [Actinorhabdospora filicis]GLZ77045.1 N-acetyltransferase [Actinorhabdospora filicis]